MSRALIRGNIVSGAPSPGEIMIEDGIIAEPSGESDEIFDFTGDYILPGFIEAHAHGGAGHDFVDGTDEAFDAIFASHRSHGVTTLCPTLCSCSPDAMNAFLELCERKKSTPGFGGVHLEGPFLSAKMCGAQNLSYIREPSDADIAAIDAHSDVIARITAAPEYEAMRELARKFADRGIVFSIGHSDLDAKGFDLAKSAGFTSVTHLYCSTPSRHKENSHVLGGLVEAALADDDCYVELIADGHHVCRESFILTLKCKGTERVCATSDAMRAARGVSPFDESESVQESYLGAISPENRVILEGGVAKLPDRSSFAGSLALGDTMARTLCKGYGLPIELVSRIMSRTPAEMLGLHDRGSLDVGKRADIVVLDADFAAKAVMIGGKIVYRRELC